MFAELRETHTGLVLLCGDRAYKVKKPVVTDFLDFGTPEARERACARELAANQRFAPDIYLGIGHLSDPEGGPAEPVLVMRRLPDSARLSAVLDRAELDASALSTLAATLADCHRRAPRGPEIDRAGKPEALRHRWRVLLDYLADELPDDALVERVDRLAMRFLDGRAPLLADRIIKSRIVDGHGDLLAEDIFALPDGFRILDCLDFDDTLRHIDGLDDAAFLAMDLEYLGHADAAATFLNEYLRAAADSPPASLRHHYLAYRATVRAKTDRIRAGQGDPDAAVHADRHLRLAAEHLTNGAVRLALVGGLPGTGKSTVAAELAEQTGAIVLSTDTTRRHMRRAGIITGGVGNFGLGVYRPDAKEQVYTRMLADARHHLEHGVSVILDASWTEADERVRAADLAARTQADLLELRCDCPGDVAAARLVARPHGDSDATPAIARDMSAGADPWPTATTLDTTAPLDVTIAAAVRTWHQGASAFRVERQDKAGPSAVPAALLSGRP